MKTLILTAVIGFMTTLWASVAVAQTPGSGATAVAPTASQTPGASPTASPQLPSQPGSFTVELILRAAGEPPRALVSWTAPEGFSGQFQLDRARIRQTTDGREFSQVKVVPAAARGANGRFSFDEAHDIGFQACYRVRAVIGSRFSDYTAEACTPAPPSSGAGGVAQSTPLPPETGSSTLHATRQNGLGWPALLVAAVLAVGTIVLFHHRTRA